MPHPPLDSCRRLGRLARLVRVGLALALGACALGPEAWAQSARSPGGGATGGRAALVWAEAPLEDALYAFAEASGLDLVFALRLVRDVRVSGRYVPGEDAEAALARLLAGTGVRAERIRAGQLVLIAEPLNVQVGDTGPEAYTGVLEGRVVDAHTGQPLPGAHVWLVDIGLGDIAGEDGGFEVPDLPTGEYVVRVSHVGYRAVRLELAVYPASPRLPPVVRLRPQPVVSAEASVGAPPPDAGPVPGVTDLAARQAAALPYALAEGDLAATLAWLPGLTRTGGAGGALVVRGADPYQTRTVRNGVPLFVPWHAFGLFTTLQPEELARVRFHRGSLPASLGGGLAAVLDVETRDGLGVRPGGTASVGPLTARLVAAAPLGPGVGLHLGARRSTLGLLVGPALRAEDGAFVLAPLGGRGPEGEGGAGSPSLSFADLGAKLTARLGPTARLDLDAFGGSDRLEASPSGLAGPGGSGIDDGGGQAYAWTSGGLSARYRGLVGRHAFLAASAYHSAHYARESPGGEAGQAETDLGESGGGLDLEYARSARFNLHAGGALALRALDARYAEGGLEGFEYRQRATELAVYAQQTWAPTWRWQIQPGLRLEATADGGPGRPTFAWSPRLHVRYAFSPDRLYVRAGVGRQTQAVHRLQPRTPGGYDLVAARWLLAGRGVPLASAWQAGAGTEWAATPALALSADAYVRLASGLLEAEPGAGSPGAPLGVGRAELLGRFGPHEGRAAGLEMAMRYGLGTWTLGASGALARAEVRPDGEGAEAWRAAPYDRPFALGLIAERRAAPLALALRADIEAGRPGEAGREGPEFRLGVAAGYRFEARGVRWDVLAQATAQPWGRAGGAPSAFGAGSLPLASDVRGLPRLPLVTLTATW